MHKNIIFAAATLFALAANAHATTINIPATAATLSNCSIMDLDTGYVGGISTCEMNFAFPVPLGSTLDKVDVNYMIPGGALGPPMLVASVKTERYNPQQGVLGLSTKQTTTATQYVQAMTIPLGYPVWDGETYFLRASVSGGGIYAISVTYH
jgi:hypothetical protein